MSGYPLIDCGDSVGVTNAETAIEPTMASAWDFDSVAASSLTAYLVGSLNALAGGATQCTFRLRSTDDAGLTAPTAGTLLGTFPVQVGAGLFSLSVTFAPPAGGKIFNLTAELDAGTASVDELTLIVEVS